MRVELITALLGFCAVALAGETVAASPASEVEVRAVRFNLLNAPGTAARWFEADVELEVRPAGNVRFVDRVRVTLSLGLKTVGAGAWRYYRSEAEAATLEAGTAHFRFYIPAEVVKRDGLRGDAELWSAGVSAGGLELPPTPRARASALRDPAREREFAANMAATAPAGDGILQPQYSTPFATVYPRETPPFVRRN